jgi:hypothetical protein
MAEALYIKVVSLLLGGLSRDCISVLNRVVELNNRQFGAHYTIVLALIFARSLNRCGRIRRRPRKKSAYVFRRNIGFHDVRGREHEAAAFVHFW